MLGLLEHLPWSSKLVGETRVAKLKAESCSRQLKAWIQSLQDSELKEERYVNEKRSEQMRWPGSEKNSSRKWRRSRMRVARQTIKNSDLAFR